MRSFRSLAAIVCILAVFTVLVGCSGSSGSSGGGNNTIQKITGNVSGSSTGTAFAPGLIETDSAYAAPSTRTLIDGNFNDITALRTQLLTNTVDVVVLLNGSELDSYTTNGAGDYALAFEADAVNATDNLTIEIRNTTTAAVLHSIDLMPLEIEARGLINIDVVRRLDGSAVLEVVQDTDDDGHLDTDTPIVIDTGASVDSDQDGDIDGNDATTIARFSFPDGTHLFDVDFDGVFAEDSDTLGFDTDNDNDVDGNDFSAKSFTDDDLLDGPQDTSSKAFGSAYRPSNERTLTTGDVQDNIGLLILQANPQITAGDDAATVEGNIRLFVAPNTNGSPVGATVTLSTSTGTFENGSSSTSVLLSPAEDGVRVTSLGFVFADVPVTIPAGFYGTATITAGAERPNTAAGDLAATGNLVVTDPNQPGRINLTADGRTLRLGQTVAEEIDIEAVVGAAGAGNVTGVDVTFTTSRGTLQSGANTGSSLTVNTGVDDDATVTLLEGKAKDGQLAFVTATVQTSDGTTISSNTIVVFFKSVAPPTITGLSAGNGVIGDTVTITGTNFVATTAGNWVTVGGTRATVNVASATQLEIDIPNGARSGDVFVANTNGLSNSSTFTVDPDITAVANLTDPGNPVQTGDLIGILGTGFPRNEADLTVFFDDGGGNVEATISGATSVFIVAVAPDGLGVAAPGDITVDVNGSSDTNSTLNFALPDMKVLKVTPANGTTNVARGSNVFVKFSSTVDADTLPGNFVVKVNDPTVTSAVTGSFSVNAAGTGATFTPTSPLAASTQYLVSINDSVEDTNATAADVFTSVFTTAAPTPPTITDITPDNGNIGDTVTITGTDMSATGATTSVFFGGASATVLSNSGTTLTARIPSGARTGDVVLIRGGLPSNVLSFTVTPEITQLGATTGAIGDDLVITGTGFSLLPNENQVSFGGTQAVVSSASTTSLTVEIPDRATGTVNVSVTVGGNTSNAESFDITGTATADSTAPTVIANWPADNATGVAVNAAPTVTFDEPMDSTSTIAAVSLANGGAVAGTVTLSSDLTTATFTPTSALSSETTYTLTVAVTAEDAATNTLAQVFTFSFTTGDTTAIGVNAVTHIDSTGADTDLPNGSTPTGLPILTEVIQVDFDDSVDPTTVNSTTFTLDDGSNNVSGTILVSTDGTIAWFAPASALAEGTTYTVTLTTGITDESGNALAANITRDFTTETDITAPNVTAVDPTDGEQDVAVNTTVIVSFDEPMDTTTTDAAFSLANGGAVTGTIAWNGSNTVLTFTPSANLTGSTTYTVTVAATAEDANGNTLAGPFTSTFDTLDNTAPTVNSVSPADQATGIAVDAFTETGVGTINIQLLGENFNPSTVTNTSVTLTETVSGATVEVTRTVSGNEVDLQTTSDLKELTQYTVTLTTAVRDLDGNALAADYTFSFTTAGDTVDPTVTSTDPQDQEADVPVTTSITVTFSEAMDTATITTTTFTVNDGSSNISGTIAFEQGNTVAIFTPSSSLTEATTYTVTITGSSGGAADVNGNTLASNETFDFTTEDTTAPTVTSNSPAADATDVLVTTTITVTFSEDVDQNTVDTNSFTVVNGGSVSGTIDFPATNQARFTPDSDLSDDTTYTVTIVGSLNGVTDLAGNPLASDHTFDFTTQDLTAPTVSSTNPADQDTNVNPGTTIAVTFDEAMNTATIDASSFTVNDGSSVSGTIAFSNGDMTATFTPSSNLTELTTVTVTITTSVTDASGNALASQYQFTFDTGDATAPSASSHTPTSNQTGVAVTSDIVVNIDEPVDPQTVTSSTFTVANGGSVSGTLTLSGSDQVITFDPTNDLDSNTTYTVNLTTGITDVSANPLTAYSFSFTTGAAPTPVISTLSVCAGPVGAYVTLCGSGFSSTTTSNDVDFNGTSATVVSATTNVLVVTVPQGAATGNVTVTRSSQTSNAVSFTVVSPATLDTDDYRAKLAAEAWDNPGSALDRRQTANDGAFIVSAPRAADIDRVALFNNEDTNGAVMVWDTANRTSLAVNQMAELVGHVVWHTTGSYIFVTLNESDELEVLTNADATPITPSGSPLDLTTIDGTLAGPRFMDLSPDGKTLVIACDSGHVAVVDVSTPGTPTLTDVLDVDADFSGDTNPVLPTIVTFHPNNQVAYVASEHDTDPATDTEDRRLLVIDVSDPTSPSHVTGGALTLSSTADDYVNVPGVSKFGDNLWVPGVFGGNGSILKVDIDTAPLAPALVAQSNIDFSAFDTDEPIQVVPSPGGQALIVSAENSEFTDVERSNSAIFVIDESDGSVVDRISITPGTPILAVGAKGDIYSLSAGNTFENVSGSDQGEVVNNQDGTTTFTDTSATFQTAGVQAGDFVYFYEPLSSNFGGERSRWYIVSVDSQTQLTLSGEANDNNELQYDIDAGQVDPCLACFSWWPGAILAHQDPYYGGLSGTLSTSIDVTLFKQVNGLALSGASVIVHNDAGTHLTTGTTDANGNVVLTGLSGSQVTVTIIASGYPNLTIFGVTASTLKMGLEAEDEEDNSDLIATFDVEISGLSQSQFVQFGFANGFEGETQNAHVSDPQDRAIVSFHAPESTEFTAFVADGSSFGGKMAFPRTAPKATVYWNATWSAQANGHTVAGSITLPQAANSDLDMISSNDANMWDGVAPLLTDTPDGQAFQNLWFGNQLLTSTPTAGPVSHGPTSFNASLGGNADRFRHAIGLDVWQASQSASAQVQAADDLFTEAWLEFDATQGTTITGVDVELMGWAFVQTIAGNVYDGDNPVLTDDTTPTFVFDRTTQHLGASAGDFNGVYDVFIWLDRPGDDDLFWEFLIFDSDTTRVSDNSTSGDLDDDTVTFTVPDLPSGFESNEMDQTGSRLVEVETEVIAFDATDFSQANYTASSPFFFDRIMTHESESEAFYLYSPSGGLFGNFGELADIGTGVALNEARGGVTNSTVVLSDGATIGVFGGIVPDGQGGEQGSDSAELWDTSNTANTFGYTEDGGQSQTFMPIARGDGHTATLLSGDDVLIVGGIDSPGTGELWDSSTGDFTALTSMTSIASTFTFDLHNAVPLNDGNVLFVGGGIDEGNPNNDAVVYQSGTDTWFTVVTDNSLLTREGAFAVNLNPNESGQTRVLFGGGVDTNGDMLGNSVVLTLPDAPTGTPTGSIGSAISLGTARGEALAVRLSNGTVAVLGGMTADPESDPDAEFLSSTELFTSNGTDGGSFAAGPDMLGRYAGLQGAPLTVNSTEMVVFGAGIVQYNDGDEPFELLDTIQAIDFTNDVTHIIGGGAEAEEGGMAVVTQPGAPSKQRIIFFGGFDDNDSPSDGGAFYDEE